MSLPVKALGLEYDERVVVLGGDPGAQRECKKVRILYRYLGYGRPRGPPLASARMRFLIAFFKNGMFLKSCVFFAKHRNRNQIRAGAPPGRLLGGARRGFERNQIRVFKSF